MTLLSDNWEAAARALPTGQKTKIECCGNSPSAMISNTRKGIGYFCFRCETKAFKPHGKRSIAEIREAREAVAQLKQLRTIPNRCVPLYDPTVPSVARVWVLRAALTPETASDEYGMRYDPQTRRVSIPIKGGFLSRAVFKEDKPKYVKSGADTEYYPLYHDRERPVVICEDIMSAIKVHKTGFNSIAILGTAFTPTVASEVSQFPTAVCWTDGDKAGDKAWVAVRKRMALHPTKVVRVRTDNDPKNIHAAEIRRLIGEQI